MCYSNIMLRAFFTHAIILILLFAVFSPVLVSAAPWDKPLVECSGALDSKTQKACTVCDIAKLAQNVLTTGIYIAVFLSAILFVWAGGLYLTSAANPSGVTKARSLFFNVFVGLLIILGAWVVIDTLMRVLVGSPHQIGPWFSIC